VLAQAGELGLPAGCVVAPGGSGRLEHREHLARQRVEEILELELLVDDVLMEEHDQLVQRDLELGDHQPQRAVGKASEAAAPPGAEDARGRHGGPPRVVTILPDSGARYLSTLYNDDWMREHGSLDG